MIRKIHSLFGIIPVGIFMLVHLILNSTVLLGDQFGAYPYIVKIMKGGSYYINIMELVIIALPILIHGLYGLYIVYIAKNNALQYTYYRNWAFYMQRITAIITFVFLGWHVWVLRIASPKSTDMATQISYVIKDMHEAVSTPLFLAIYIICVMAAIFHFANGLATFTMTWGLTVGPKSQNFMTLLSLAIFAGLSVLAIAILYKFSIIDPNFITVDNIKMFFQGGAQ